MSICHELIKKNSQNVVNEVGELQAQRATCEYVAEMTMETWLKKGQNWVLNILGYKER